MEDKTQSLCSLSEDLQKDQQVKPVFDFAHCDKLECTTREKRSRFSAGQRSSGYSSSLESDSNNSTYCTSDSEFGATLRHKVYAGTHMADTLDSSTTVMSNSKSDSELTDEEDDNEEYLIEVRERRELTMSPSTHPRLFSPVSELYEGNRFVPSTVISTNQSEIENKTVSEESVPRADEAAISEQALDNNKILGEDRAEKDVGKKMCDASGVADGSSKTGQSPSGYEIVKRKSAYLKLYGSYDVDFCKIQTVKYRHRAEKSIQHYKKNLRPEEKDIEGDIGLREGDLLLEVNGKKLLNRKQKHLIKIFKKIKANKDGKIYMNLRFRRWETRINGSDEQEYEVEYELKLVLEPIFPYGHELERNLERETSTEEIEEIPADLRSRGLTHSRSARTRRSAFKYRVSSGESVETNKTLLPKGNIDYIKSEGERDAKIKCLACGPDEFLTAEDSTLTLSVPLPATADNEIFTLKEFKGVDTSPEPLSYLVFCVRIQTSETLGGKFVSSSLDTGHTLCLRESVSTVTSADDVDETCFIKREFGRQVLLESLLYRGHFIGCKTKDAKTFSLKMVKKSYNDLIHDNNLGDAKFEIFYPGAEDEEDARHNYTDDADSLVKHFTMWNEIHSRNYLA